MDQKRGCFKFGCLGCAGVAAIAFVVLVVLVALGWFTGRGERRVEPIGVQRPIPGPADTIGRTDPGSVAGEVELIDREIEVAEPGRIVLDLNRGEFEIIPGPAGEPVRIEGQYDAGHFALKESYETYGEIGWTYRVSFDQLGLGIRPFIDQGEMDNRIRLIVPRGAPIKLEGRVGIGQSNLELGGLWLVDVDLELGIGEHRIGFDDPLPIPLNRLDLDTSVGELEVDGIGNASPQTVRITHSIGETRIDLSGAWRRDADVDIRCGIGQCDVRVPRDVGVDVKRARVSIGGSSSLRDRDPVRPGAATLSLSVSGTIGELSVR